MKYKIIICLQNRQKYTKLKKILSNILWILIFNVILKKNILNYPLILFYWFINLIYINININLNEFKNYYWLFKQQKIIEFKNNRQL